MLKHTAVFPGTFDPLHSGHIDIIKRAAKLFSHLYVAVSINVDKKNSLDLNQRYLKVKRQIEKLRINNVSVLMNERLVIDLLKKLKCRYLVRSIRDTNDIKYEIGMAQNNYFLDKNIETLFFVANSKLSDVSSTNIRTLNKHRKAIKQFQHE